MVFSTVSQQKHHLLVNSSRENTNYHFLILWYCVLLPGGATHENTTQGFV